MSELELREQFFTYLFGEKKGWLCIATESSVKGDFKQRFFQWPLQASQLLTYINKEKSKKNIWFCVSLLSRKERVKEACIAGNLLWADLDECEPDIIDPKPQLVIESSPERYQAIWRLDEELDPQIAEDYSRRIFGQYQVHGVDSGWERNKLLRVPFTNNLKYDGQPSVKLLRAIDPLLPTSLFDAMSYVSTNGGDELEDAEIPEVHDAEEIIARNYGKLRENGFPALWAYEPDSNDDWSKLLWRLIMVCLESGLDKHETFSVAYHSSVNKYARDNKPIRYLWRDVSKAALQLSKFEVLATNRPYEMPELIPGDNYKLGSSFIEKYIKWGEEATDASVEYHELSVFILLSSLLSGNLKLETSFGTIRPNIWGMILGDSTLTRKSTAMRMAVDIIDFIDTDILLATDGSAEGILTGLAGRPGKPSMFFRDEVVGFFDSIRKKDYLAGVPQLFTQLYDSNPVRRVLRKELITVDNPVFIFFGGGIRDQFFVACDDSFVYSGFLPRFLIVSGTTDRTRLRRLGPPTPELSEKKQAIYSKFHEIYHAYYQEGEVEILGQPAIEPVSTTAHLTPEAYDLFGEISDRMVEAAGKAPDEGKAYPTYERMSWSMLKMALLAAACRQTPQDFQIEVTDADLRRAAKYVQQWGQHSLDVIANLGQTVANRTVDRALKYIRDHPGATRSNMSRAMNLTKRQVVEIEETLEARGHIRIIATGSRGRRYELEA